ncbi:hypothetical protein ACHAW6_005428, partial [Cyclotella cf. meneghiniana]
DYNKFGILKWEITKLKSAVDFLDLTLKIKNGQITTMTYQKLNNPYLYIPLHSSHPPGMINGVIFSLLWIYYHQNSEYSDFVHFSNLLYKHHIMQDWEKTFFKKVFNNDFIMLITKPSTASTTHATDPADLQDPLIFHMGYHPMDVPRMIIKKIYREECKKVLQKEPEVKQLIIAYSHHNTIGTSLRRQNCTSWVVKKLALILRGS